jgi:hypothetical protein
MFNNVWYSPFGHTLHAYALDLQARGTTPPGVTAAVSSVAAQYLPRRNRNFMNRWGDASTVMDRFAGRMHDFLSTPGGQGHLAALVSPIHRLGEDCWTGLDRVDVPLAIKHDQLWALWDEAAWKAARELDWQDTPGRVAREFGLVDPKDPNRPRLMSSMLRHQESAQRLLVPAPPEEKPYVETVPVAHPSERVTQSGHAFAAKTEGGRAKLKPKTKSNQAAPLNPDIKEGDVDTLTVEIDEMALAEDSFEALPSRLPSTFHVPRKIAKVCCSLSPLTRAPEHYREDLPQSAGVAEGRRWPKRPEARPAPMGRLREGTAALSVIVL